MFDKEFEQTEFGARQHDGATFYIRQPPIDEVERSSREKRHGFGGGASCGPAAAQARRMTLRTRAKQFSGIEGLGDVIVGTDFPARSPVDRVAAGPVSMMMGMLRRLRVLRHREQAVFARQIQVQQDQIDGGAR